MIYKSTMFGFYKSGNSLFHRILRAIYEQTEIGYTSILNNRELNFVPFEGYDQVDHVTYEGDVLGTRKGGGSFERVDKRRLDNASVIWCHDVITRKHIDELVGKERVGFYLERDPKQVLLSYAYHSTRLSQYYEEYKIRDAEKVISNPKIIMGWLDNWKNHVEAIKRFNKLTIVKYEKLSGPKKKEEVERICKKLKVQAGTEFIETILTKTSKETMSANSPQHIGGRDYKLKFSYGLEKQIEDSLKSLYG